MFLNKDMLFIIDKLSLKSLGEPLLWTNYGIIYHS